MNGNFPGLVQAFFTDRLLRQRKPALTPSPATEIPFACCCILLPSDLKRSRPSWCSTI